jgi:heterodisulfide reductase subunit C
MRKWIEQSVNAKSYMCWTCRSCANECPVNQATNRLQPIKIVRMANLGLFDDLLHSPEIWYCQRCNRCNQVCPMTIKPAALIEFIRSQAVKRRLVAYDTVRRYADLIGRFQRVRWQMAVRCLNEEDFSLKDSDWYQWLNTPIKGSGDKIYFNQLSSGASVFSSAKNDSKTAACFTCGECSSACPVFYERGVFNPVSIFRMVNLGLTEELLNAPIVWLCIACQRCTNACSQLVQGHLTIQKLKELSIAQGFVSSSFPLAWKQVHDVLYPRLLDEIDDLFGFQGKPPKTEFKESKLLFQSG